MKPTSGSVRFPILGFITMPRSMNSQNLPDIAAMRMTYLMYYVAWIYVLDSIPCLDTCACGDNGRRQVYHSRDIKPHTLDKS